MPLGSSSYPVVTASCLAFCVPLSGSWKSQTQGCLGGQNNPMKTGKTVGEARLAAPYLVAS